MTLKTTFTIAAIITFIMGLGITLAPATMLGNFGADANPASTHMARALGGSVLALAIMTWLARSSGPSKARSAIAVGLSVFFVLESIEDVRAMMAGILNPTAWISVALSAILVFLVIFTGRSAIPES